MQQKYNRHIIWRKQKILNSELQLKIIFSEFKLSSICFLENLTRFIRNFSGNKHLFARILHEQTAPS